MNNAPVFLSTLSLIASVDMTIMDANIAYRPVIITSCPDTSTGKIKGPIPMAKLASTMQLPIRSPTASLYCLLRIAVISTTSSGRDVPMATTKKLMRYSETWKTYDIVITDSITAKDPIPTPAKPRAAITK